MPDSPSATKDSKEGSRRSRWRSRSRSRSRSPYSKRRDNNKSDDRDRDSKRRYSRSRSPRSRSPRRRSPSPRRRSPSPRRKSPSPRRRSPSPRHGSRSPRRRSRSRSPPAGGWNSRSSNRSRSPRGRNDRGGFKGQDRGRGGGGRGRGRGGPKHESTFRGGSGGGSKGPDVWGEKIMAEEEAERKKKPVIAEEDKEKPNFGLSGALAAETNTTANGTLLKYNEPPEARKPKQKWRLYVFKDGKEIDLLHIHRQSAFLFGRDRNVVDIPIDHPSCSKQHAVIQFRQVVETDSLGHSSRRTKPFVLDLESANGTFVNGTQIPPTRYYELKLSDIVKFGASTREFVLLHEGVENDD
ncbi:hypothetical protein BGZ76_001952 [Entomortierella beljakovae]|nr:hypothetical protein BGZ76_001952 [Entomortierella beljakovae]